jgi:Mn2+/Fe2+ NRAMP family transporter
MAVCAGCGIQFESRSESPVHGGAAHLVKLPVRALFLALAALFLIGSFVMIGVNVGTALAGHDFSLPTMSLSIIFVVIFVLMVLVFRNLRRADEMSRYCPDCAMKY